MIHESSWRLSVGREPHETASVFVVKGRLTARTAPGFSAELAKAAADHRGVVVDCTDLDYLSSAGLLALDEARRRLDAVGGLVLCGLCEPVRLVIDLAGLTPRFAIEPSRDRALERITDGRRAAERDAIGRGGP